MKNILFIAGLGVLIVILLYLIILYIEYKAIKISKSIGNTGFDKQDFEARIAKMKITKKVERIGYDKTEELLRLSKNPMKFSIQVFKLITVFLPVILFFLGLALSLLTFTYDYIVLGIVLAFALSFLPSEILKGKIADREIAWNKVYGYIWRLSEELEVNDVKKSLLTISAYFDKIGEKELAEGFNDFYEGFPVKPEEIDRSAEEIAKVYPFSIPMSLFNLLTESWQYNQSSTERLEKFKESITLRYQKASDDILSKIPTKTTIMSLPFLLLAVFAVLLAPALLEITSQL